MNKHYDCDFSQYHVHIGIPCYGGALTESCFTSILRFTLYAQHVGLRWSLDTMVNESLVTRARNSLAAKMMANSAATHFMFVDADVQFSGDAILDLLAADRDVVAGAYPKKSYPIKYAINPTAGADDSVVCEVDTAATGFLMFRRGVYEKLIAAYPEKKYVDDIGLGKQYEPWLYSIFETEIEDNHLLSEDWVFCRRWQKLGGKIYVHREIVLNHCGFHVFAGNAATLQSALGR